MIVDAHYHLLDEGFMHDKWWEGVGRTFMGIMRAQGSEVPGSPLEVGKGVGESLFDPGGEKVIAGMDEAGVEKSLLLALDFGLRTGDPAVGIVEQNQRVVEVAKRHPGRIIPMFTIDPRRPGALDAFRTAVDDWGMKALKFHGTAGFFPWDPVCYPFYEICQERALAVLLHTGNQPPPMKARFTQPVHVDDVAADFPGVNFVCAHLGFAWHEELLALAAVKPNIYMDFFGWQMSFQRDPSELLQILRRIVDELGAHRVFWGSDGPYLTLLTPLATWRNDFEKAAREHGFTEAELGQLMGDAAALVYGA